MIQRNGEKRRLKLERVYMIWAFCFGLRFLLFYFQIFFYPSIFSWNIRREKLKRNNRTFQNKIMPSTILLRLIHIDIDK